MLNTLNAREMEQISLDVQEILEEDLETTKKAYLLRLDVLKSSGVKSSKDEAEFVEYLTCIDQRLENIPRNGVKAWLFRTKRRARYFIK